MSIRLALTIPGGVALGAYEGGALAALLTAVGELCEGDDPPICVDLIGAASAGSLTSVVVCRSLLEGLDPVDLLRRVWVEKASLASLLTTGRRAPLSERALEDLATEFLLTPGRPTGTKQRVPITVTVALANLRGLSYRLPELRDQPATVVTYLDWADFTVAPDKDGIRFQTPEGVSVLDLVLASSANPLGFPARLVSRSADKHSYDAAGVNNFPATGAFWYTDGSLLNRRPLARTLRLARRRDATVAAARQRVHVVLEPQPIAASSGLSWADPGSPPGWLHLIRRSVEIIDAQSIFDDLKASEDVNTRCRAVDVFSGHMTAAVATLDEPSRRILVTALTKAASDLGGGPEPGGSVDELFRTTAARVAGVTGRAVVPVEIISPDLVPGVSEKGARSALAGDFLFRFGGLLDRALRQSDFDLGYASVRSWLQLGRLSRYGLPADDARRALEAVERAYKPGDAWRAAGNSGFGSLPWRGRLILARFLASAGVSAARGMLEHRRQRIRGTP